jgi:hypothetical protein
MPSPRVAQTRPNGHTSSRFQGIVSGQHSPMAHDLEPRHQASENSATEAEPAAEPAPQPELGEPRLTDPGVGDLSTRDYLAIVVRAVKSALADNVTNLAACQSANTAAAAPIS